MDILKNLMIYLRVIGVVGAFRTIVAKLLSRQIVVNVKDRVTNSVVWLRAPSSDIYTYYKIFILKEYDFDIFKPPKVIVDAGANIGLSTLFFSQKFSLAHVYAIEPEKANFWLLQKNLAGTKNVTCINSALWSESGNIELFDAGLGSSGFITGSKSSDWKISTKPVSTIPAVTMVDCISQFGLERIDILKVDIEGAEKEVFSNSESWIDKVELIAIELHERMKEGCEAAFYNATASFNYKSRRGENVIVAKV